MSKPVATLGDTSNHGGTIISACDRHYANNGRRIARLGDLHSCPIPGHGVTPIVAQVSAVLEIEGKMVALHGSVCGCGAVIIASATSPEA
ncbi:PAAR domain-containing protein [Xanthobacter sp. TB0136]|uniref:PAAR domain-containing protein n=1 Tax=Xanthobacter sp. TB0136 TaxID=3459177 RepID=UPI0040399F0A